MEPVQFANGGIVAADGNVVTRLVIPCDESSGLAQPGGDDVERRTLDVPGNFLLEPGDGDASLPDNRPGIGKGATIQEPHERAFPGTIATEDAHALSTLDREVGVVEHRQPSERDADFADTYYSHSLTPTPVPFS